MYKSFRVKNFRCFRDLEVKDLGRVNLIAGRNNTGKTALMEAMHVHAGSRDPKTLIRLDSAKSNRRFLMPDLYEPDFSAPNLLSWDSVFCEFKADSIAEMEAEYTHESEQLFSEPFATSVLISAKSLDSQDLDDVIAQLRLEDLERYDYVEILEIKSDYDRRTSYLAILNGRVRVSRIKSKAYVNSDFLYPREKADARTNALRFSAMRTGNGLDPLLDALRVIEPRLEGLELLIEGAVPVIHANIGLRQLLSITHLGDGFNRMTEVMLAMSEVPGGVIFIDEIENGIHHTVQENLWRLIASFANELDIQVFATTHSLEMIRAAYEAFSADGTLEDFRYHRLDRYPETGDIEAVTYNRRGLEALATFDFDFEVRG